FFVPVLGLFPSMATGWAGFLLFRRIRAAGCRIEPDGLRVRNVFSETVVAWDRIERFGLGEAGWQGAALHRTNGTTLSMTGIRAHARDPAAAAIMDRLTAELIRRRRAIQWDWRPGEPVQTPRRPALSAQLRPGFAIALAVVGGICLGPLAIGIAVEAGKDSGGIGAVAACMGLFGAPAIAVIRLRHRKAPLAFTTLVLTYLVISAMMADGVAV